MADTQDLLNNLGSISAGALDDDDDVAALNAYDPQQQQHGPQQRPYPYNAPAYQQPPAQQRRPARRMHTQKRLSEIYLRHAPESDPNFMVTIVRLYPRSSAGSSGWLDDYTYPIYEREIKEKWGGGRFEVVIKGTDPKTREPGHVKDSIIVDIVGEPIEDIEKRRRDRSNGSGNRYDELLSSIREQQMHNQQQQPHNVTVQSDNSAANLMAQTLRDVLSGSSSSKDYIIEQLRDMQRHNSGAMSPEMLQNFIASYEAQKEAQQTRYEALLTEAREHASRDLERSTSRLERQLEDERATRHRIEEDGRRREDDLRNRYERDINQLRDTLEDERRESRRVTERMENTHRDTVSRMENNFREELKRAQHESEQRIRLAEKAKEDALSIERDRNKLIVDQVSENAKQQMQSVTDQAKTNATHMQRLQEVAQKAEETRSESLVGQLKYQLDREREERKRAEDEMRRYREKAEEKEDIPAQLEKYRGLADMFGSFFGVEETAIVPAKSGDDIWTKAQSLLNSKFGQRAGEVLGAMVGGAMSGPPPGSPMPPQMPQPHGPVPPTPRQQPMPQPQGPYSPDNPPQPRTPPVDYYGQPGPTPPQQLNPSDIEAEIERAMHGQQEDFYPNQSPPQPQQLTPEEMAEMQEALERLARWVQAVEQHIEQGSDPKEVAEIMRRDLPEDALDGFREYPIEMVVGQVTAQVPSRGIISSEKGFEYLRKVQDILKGETT